VPLWHDPYKRAYTECVAFHRSAIARIQRLRPDLVVIGSSFNYRPAYPEADAAAQWRAAWDRTYAQLRGSGARLVAIADTPYLGGSVPDCLAAPENQQDAAHCATRLRDSLRGRVQREVFLSYAGRPRTTIVDPVGWFCTDVCPAIVGNLLVYRDSNHMTTAYAEALTPLLAARISAAGRPASVAGPRPR
jgi:hypothetical protein